MKLSLMCGALVISTAAFAAANDSKVAAVSTPIKPAASFGYLDTDRDARLSREEAKADWAVSQRFGSADANRDGYLDEDEFKKLSRS